MFRGFVIRVRPSEEQISQLPFKPRKYAVSSECLEKRNRLSEESHISSLTQCVCRCCCFSFEVTEEELVMVPDILWGQTVAWRKLPNPIGLDSQLDSDLAKKILGHTSVAENQMMVPSRIPGLPHKRMQTYSKAAYDSWELTIDLSNGNIGQKSSSNKKSDHTSSHVDIPRLAVMGCGGTGCEIIKTLFLRGFHSITVIDRDTIDLSNLNRQLLFTNEDIGKSKALVSIGRLHEALKRSKFYQSMVSAGGSLETYISELRSLHGNIESFYTLDESALPFSLCSQDRTTGASNNLLSSHLCYSALDNIPTRQYINRLSYSLGKPVIESGVSGLDGQVQPICVDCSNQCYDCLGIKSADQVNRFAVCTIHAKPTKVVHCVHYAQELYNFIAEQLQKNSPKDDCPVGEFDELSSIFRDALQDTSKEKTNVYTAIVELFNYMCAERVIKRFEIAKETDDEEKQDVGRKRKRPEGESSENIPSVCDFSEFIADVLIEKTPIESTPTPWENRIHRKIALALYFFSMAVMLGMFRERSFDTKKIKTSFIFAVTFFRCMVFRISMDKEYETTEDPFVHHPRILDVALPSHSTGEGPSQDSLQKFLIFITETSRHSRNALYRHIESISMRIIPSVSSANAMISALAVSMGTKSLYHVHSQNSVLYSSGTKYAAADASKNSFCSGDYLRHIYMLSKPMSMRERGKKSKAKHNMGLYSHPLFRSKDDCPTCASYHSPSKRYHLLVNASKVAIRALRECVLRNVLAIDDPTIDMAVSCDESSKQELRMLYEHDEFENNDSQYLSKWMDLHKPSPLHLIISSAENTTVRVTMSIYHDIENKLSKNTVLLKCDEAPRRNHHMKNHLGVA